MEIQAVVNEVDPDLMFISEANLREGVDEVASHVDGYELVYPSTMSTQGYARIMLLVKEGVSFKKMENFMDENAASIWVKIVKKGGKPLHIGGIYRDHRLLLQEQPNLTGDPLLQRQRWSRIINGWKKAEKNANVVVIGDSNLDYLRWGNPEPRVQRMVQQMKDEIVTLGFGQLVSGVTRSWPGQPSSLIDQIWTNAPGCVISWTNKEKAPSDHNIIGAVLRTRDRETQGQDIYIRDRKRMDLDRYRKSIADIDWGQYYQSRDVIWLNSFLEDKLREILDAEAPLKGFQARRKHHNWITQDLKVLMSERDDMKKSARISGDPGMKSDYRRLRNKCTKELEKGKRKYYNDLFTSLEKENYTKKIYNETRRLLNWKTGISPRTFLMEGKILRKPLELANAQLEYFKTKIEGLVRNLPGGRDDPLKWLKYAKDKWRENESVPIF